MASRFTVFKGKTWRINMRGWPFVIVVGLILAALAIIDDGALSGVRAANTATSCSFQVNGNDVNVRNDATATSSAAQRLAIGETVAATGVTDNGFRQLADGKWVLNSYLTPVVGNTCA